MFLIRWWRASRKRRRCFHHDNHTGTSWIGLGRIIDYRKMYACGECGRVWII